MSTFVLQTDRASHARAFLNSINGKLRCLAWRHLDCEQARLVKRQGRKRSAWRSLPCIGPFPPPTTTSLLLVDSFVLRVRGAEPGNCPLWKSIVIVNHLTKLPSQHGASRTVEHRPSRQRQAPYMGRVSMLPYLVFRVLFGVVTRPGSTHVSLCLVLLLASIDREAPEKSHA